MCVVHRCSVQGFSTVSEMRVSPDVVERLVLVPVPPVGPLLVQQLTLCSHVHLVNGGVRTLGWDQRKWSNMTQCLTAAHSPNAYVVERKGCSEAAVVHESLDAWCV